MKGPEAVEILDETQETAKDRVLEKSCGPIRRQCLGANTATIAAGSNASIIALPLPMTQGEGKGDLCASWLTRVV